MGAEVINGPSQLYRHFDANGVLLYVGVSLSALGRLAQHKDSSHWFPEIKSVQIELFSNRKEALAAEREAIFKERPRHNVHHRSKAAQEIEMAKEGEFTMFGAAR